MSFEKAQTLRKNQTEAEKKLWRILRNRKFSSFKFKRQVPIGHYIVDFICHEKNLILEMDGGQHSNQVEADENRTAWLEKRGYKIVRFWNNEVLDNIEGVLTRIEEHLEDLLT